MKPQVPDSGSGVGFISHVTSPVNSNADLPLAPSNIPSSYSASPAMIAAGLPALVEAAEEASHALGSIYEDTGMECIAAASLTALAKDSTSSSNHMARACSYNSFSLPNQRCTSSLSPSASFLIGPSGERGVGSAIPQYMQASSIGVKGKGRQSVVFAARWSKVLRLT